MNEALPDAPEVRVAGLPQLTSGSGLVDRFDLPMHLKVHGPLEPLCAEAMRARTLVVGVTRESTQRSVEAALAERGLSNGRRSALRARVQRDPVRTVTGAAASLIRSIDGGPAIPPGRRTSASKSGVGGAPTLLSDAETFARLAVAARVGPERYRNTGLYDEPAP